MMGLFVPTRGTLAAVTSSGVVTTPTSLEKALGMFIGLIACCYFGRKA